MVRTEDLVKSPPQAPVRTNVWLIVLFCARGVNMDMAAAGQVDKLRHVSAHSKPMRTALSKVL
jgi:hypothetical protein